MPFKKKVEIGRIALVNLAEDELYNRLVVIVDVVDQNRALVDLPDIVRRPVSFKRLAITDFKVDIKRCPRKQDLKQALDNARVYERWAQSSWGKKIAAQQKKKALTDFERYKLKVARSKRADVIKKHEKPVSA